MAIAYWVEIVVSWLVDTWKSEKATKNSVGLHDLNWLYLCQETWKIASHIDPFDSLVDNQGVYIAIIVC